MLQQQDQSAVQEALVQSGTMSETVKADETSVDETSSTAVRLPMISFMEFKAGDIALFIPHLNENRKNWIAFHANCPHHYLAEVNSMSTLMFNYLINSFDRNL